MESGFISLTIYGNSMNRKHTNFRRKPRADRDESGVAPEAAPISEPEENGEPGHGRNEGRDYRGGRDGREGRDPKDQERMDKEFLKEMEMRIGYFLESGERELELEPMNSYRRRMVHDMVKNFGLTSESRGEDRSRYVTLIKTEETKVPAGKAPRLWDFGNQVFPVNPGSKGIHLALKLDGTVEIYQASEKKHIVDDRVVTSKAIRIRKGKILQPEDPGY